MAIKYEIKIKRVEDSELATKENLEEILKNLNVNLSQIIATQKGFIVLCPNINDAEFIVSETTSEILRHIKLEPTIPEEIKSARSVIIRPRDSTLMNIPPDEIKTELNNKNDLKVDTVYILKEMKAIKIKFSQLADTKKCLKRGLLLFNRNIPVRDISNEEFIKLSNCYTCYQWEDHMSKQCPKKIENPNYVICPKCSSTDHDYRSCLVPQSDFKCISCSENHHTLAFKCKVRKNFVNLKRKGELPTSYAGITRKTSLNYSNLTPKQDKSDIIMTCICAAIIKNDEEPGCFKDVLNSLLVENQLSQVNMSIFVPPKASNTRIKNLLHQTLNSNTNPIPKNSHPHPSSSHGIPRSNNEEIPTGHPYHTKPYKGDRVWTNSNQNKRDPTNVAPLMLQSAPKCSKAVPLSSSTQENPRASTSTSNEDSTVPQSAPKSPKVPQSAIITEKNSSAPMLDQEADEVLSQSSESPYEIVAPSTSTPRSEKRMSAMRLNSSEDSQKFDSCHEEINETDWSSFTVYRRGSNRKRINTSDFIKYVDKNDIIIVDVNDCPPPMSTIKQLIEKYGLPEVESLRNEKFQQKLESINSH